ncbi:MAG TPA: hypothetical protein PKC24_04665 [Cyclobacteriaceae bacterium]|nr:hypothetical protein [Cyclobacteriaceae bacterium]
MSKILNKKAIVTFVLLFCVSSIFGLLYVNNKGDAYIPEEIAAIQTEKMVGLFNLSEDQRQKAYEINLEIAHRKHYASKVIVDNARFGEEQDKLRDEHVRLISLILNDEQRSKLEESENRYKERVSEDLETKASQASHKK